MKLLIFGSTGSIGRQLVEQALERGHTVTAFARDPAKLDIKHAHLKFAQGDVMDSHPWKRRCKVKMQCCVCLVQVGKGRGQSGQRGRDRLFTQWRKQASDVLSAKQRLGQEIVGEISTSSGNTLCLEPSYGTCLQIMKGKRATSSKAA